MKKTGLLLLFLLLFTFQTVNAKTGTCGTNVSYQTNENTIIFSKTDVNTKAEWSGDCTNTFKYDSDIMYVEVQDKIILSEEGGVFSNCDYVLEMHLSNLDTSNVTNMSHMFSHCDALRSLDISEWNTSNVKSMEGMFWGSATLRRLDMNKWDTSNVTNLNRMFYECRSLRDLYVSNWNTSNVTNMAWLFDGCYSLENLDVSKWNTSNITNLSLAFSKVGVSAANWQITIPKTNGNGINNTIDTLYGKTSDNKYDSLDSGRLFTLAE